MNGITQSSTSPNISRIDILAAEINNIKNQTRKIMLYNSIEIGRRLTEAKQLVEHGEWGNWLENSVDYSQRTANNLMRIFEEYGADQLTLLEDNAKSQAIANLSYTQAVALLGVPENERGKFIEEHDVENMSTRELQKAIKEREQAIKEKEELEQKLKIAEKEVQIEREHQNTVSESYKRLEKINKEHCERAEQLRKELEETKKQLSDAKALEDEEEVERLQASLNETESELIESRRKIVELEQKLKEKPIEVDASTVIEKIPEDLERELKELRELRKKTNEDKSAVKFQIVFDELVKKFNELLITLKDIKDIDTCEKYKKAVSTLINMMNGKL